MKIQEAARHIIVGFEGAGLSAELDDLLKLGVGGVILFSRNYSSPEQVADLISTIKHRAFCKELIVAVDQEGGRVMRFSKPFTPWPPMRALGNKRDPSAARKVGRFLAEELSAIGINLNFAPVLDVDSNPQNPVIGDRSISDDPKVVAMLGSELILGMQENGVMACAKHFPGHGDTFEDSHLTLPVCQADQKTLKSRELPPFAKAIEIGVTSVMTAHVLYPAIDKKNPSSLSPKIINCILREKMGYQGIVFSDDLLMKAISDNTKEAAVQAIAAGSDMALVCKDAQRQEQAVAGLFDAVMSGRLKAMDLPDRESRIQKILRSMPSAPLKPKIGSDEAHELAEELSKYL